MMKVLLILPTFRYNQGYPSFYSNTDLPSGFAYIASAIRDSGHEVVGLNPNNDPNYSSAHEMLHDKLSQSLLENKPDLIGLGGLSIDFKFIEDAMQIIREKAPNTPIVLGGGIINYDVEFIFSALSPDFCIIGEGEEIIVDLIKIIESDKPDYEKIPNLGYWDKGIPKFTKEDFNYIDIDRKAFPDYEPFGIRTMLNEYSMATRYVYRYTRANPRPMTIVSSRGCPFSCTFCIHKKGSKYRKYRSRSIENIMQEIKELYDKYQFNILLILDELFVISKERLREFCLALDEARNKYGWDFDWIFQTHANASIDRETLEMAKNAGCYCFTYGIESASPLVLASMNKNSKPSQFAAAIDLANSLELGFYANFIFGDVVETEETIHETMSFFAQHCMDIHINFAAISPYPGSQLFEDCLNNGLISDKMKYYNSIDKQIFNMTTIPNRVWFPWIYLVMYLSKYAQFTKSTNATYCEVDPEAADNPIASYYNNAVYKIEADCPHCDHKNQYSELLKSKEEPFVYSKKRSIFANLEEFTMRAVGLSTIRYNMSKLMAKGLFLLLISFKHPLLKTLKPLMGEKDYAPFFTTCCQHCNKRINVNIPIGGNNQRFNAIRKLLQVILRNEAAMPKPINTLD